MPAPQIHEQRADLSAELCKVSRFLRRYAARMTIQEDLRELARLEAEEPTCTHRRAPSTVVPMRGTRGRNAMQIAADAKRYFTLEHGGSRDVVPQSASAKEARPPITIQGRAECVRVPDEVDLRHADGCQQSAIGRR